MTLEHLPTPPGFFDSVLRVLAEHPDGVARKNLHEPVADRMQLSPEQRALRLPSEQVPKYRHRTGWALTMLKNAGLARSVARGVWGLTEPGMALVRSRPEGLSDGDVRSIERASREVVDSDGDSMPAPASDEATSELTPSEQIDAAIATIRRELSRDLLEQVGQASPEFFETLVMELLLALGYGTHRNALQHVGGASDGGIDGIIALDKLGLEKIYVQAKRLKGTVERPEIQAFYGALAGRRAKKGVFITTSSYTREAQQFAETVSDSIVLVDGARLASLMIDYGIGVHNERTIQIPRLDTDYFDEA